MDNQYICALFKNKISGLIHTVHLINLKDNIKYNGASKIGSSSYFYLPKSDYHHEYDYFIYINQNQFLKILNTPYKDIYGKSINGFSKKFNIGIENFI